MSAQLQKINQIHFVSKTLSEKDLEERKTITILHIEKHPELEALVQVALQKGALTINFEDRRSGFVASCLLHSNCIFINPNIIETLEVLDCFVFELCNLTNTKFIAEDLETISFFEECLKAAPNGYASLLKRFPGAVEYAKAVEQGEYLTDVRAAKIMQSGIKMYGWPKLKYGQHVHDDRSWQKYLEDAIYPDSWPKHGLTHFQNYMNFY